MKQMTLWLILSLFILPVSGWGSEKQVVKAEEVRTVIADYLKNRTANLDVELSIKKIGFKDDLKLPPGPITYEVVAPRQWEGWGTATLALIVRVNDRVERNVSVRVEVEALADMLVTKRPLERGEVVAADDVSVQKRDLAGIQGHVCRKMEEVVGKRLTTTIRANAPLRAESLEKVPLVKSGQLVTILVENDMIRLTASGQVKTAGAAGDVVLVRNTASQKEIAARVVDAHTVKVDF